MKRITWIWLAVLLPTMSMAGNVYVCKGKHGETVFQGVPCAKDTKPLKHLTYDNAMGRPGAPEPAYEHRAPTQPGVVTYQGSALIAPPRASASQPVTQGNYGNGLGTSAYQRGDVQGTRCTSSDGRVYYTAGACGTTTHLVGSQQVERNWQNDTVQGMPGVVMSGPDQAFDPRTGKYIQLQHADETQTVNVYKTQHDRAAPVDANTACDGARQTAAAHPYSTKDQNRVESLCRQGRSLYDTQPSNRSLYGGG